MLTCNIPACERQYHGKGYCEMHYVRMRRHGSPLLKRRARGVMDAPVVPLKPTGSARQSLPMRRAEIATLQVLVARRKTVSVRELATITGATTGTVQHAIASVRKRFGTDVIRTRWGRGYELGNTSPLVEGLGLRRQAS